MNRWRTFAAGLVWATAATGSEAAPGSPIVPVPSIGPEGQAVYEAVLASWLDADATPQLVNLELGPPPSVSDPDLADCAKGLHFSSSAQATQSERSLDGVQFKKFSVKLIDGSQWKSADPSELVLEGKSVEEAVKRGFSHSLISFSQIAFSEDGKDALVEFGMVCGGLCGSGSTVRLHRTKDDWRIVKRCSGWIS